MGRGSRQTTLDDFRDETRDYRELTLDATSIVLVAVLVYIYVQHRSLSIFIDSLAENVYWVVLFDLIRRSSTSVFGGPTGD